MGGGSFTSRDWDDYATTKSYATKAPDEVINKSGVFNDFLPSNFKNARRESRDSADHPVTTPIIVGGDVTGSMGMYAGMLIKDGMAKFALSLIERKVVPGPQIMGMAFDDVHAGIAPFVQGTQFESDIRLADQFSKLYVTGGGGGNKSESYDLVWAVAALMTSTDAVEKRGEKGVLITYGDEQFPYENISVDKLRRALGPDVVLPQGQSLFTPADILAMARRSYDVMHLVIEQGDYCRHSKRAVYDTWNEGLGVQNVIPVDDATKLAEIMTSKLEVMRAGRSVDAVVASWSGSTSLAVKKALSTSGAVTKRGSGSGVVTL